ncbi:MAG: cupin-like domain-containing protein [Myxococcota bacterium]|nr:cupin-like domain-containing protein [Myxococcota bacterium]
MQKINRITDIQSLHQHVQRNEPCVYKVPPEKQLPFQKKWSKEFLLKQVGSTEVKVRNSASKKYVDPEENFWPLVGAFLLNKMTFAEFMNMGAPHGMVMSGTETYIHHNGESTPAWKELWQDASGLTMPEDENIQSEWLTPEDLHTVGLWVSGKGVKSILHYDDSGDNNFNFQVLGSKRITLFPPQDWPNLKTILALGLHGMEAFEALHQPPLSPAASILESTNPHVAHLEKDEVLYIPSRWYHFVEHEGEFNINLTYWFKRGPIERVDENIQQLSVPGRSCRDHLLVLKLSGAMFLAAMFNLFWKVTGLRLGDWICNRLAHVKKALP